MATTIKLKNSVTTTNAPSSLVQGEVAINITDKKVWVGNAATTPIQLLGDGGSASFTSIAFGAGTVSNPSITFTGDTNTGIYSPAADTIAFTEGGVESMRIDSSGNVGIGVTPSAWSAYKGLNIGLNTTLAGSTSGSVALLSTNAYFDGSSYKYISTDAATQYQQNTGEHIWRTAASGSAGATLTFTERMRIDSSGNVGIGTSTTNAGRLSVVNSSGSSGLNIDGQSATGTGAFLRFRKGGVDTGFLGQLSSLIGSGTSSDLTLYTEVGINQLFYTGGAERMRITSGGDFIVGGTTVFSNARVTFNSTTAGNPAIVVSKFDNDSTTAQVIMQFLFNNGASGLGQINGNGSGAAAFGTYSDIRLKENITNIDSQLGNICALRPVEFDYKTGGHQIGFIAQEMQEIYPDAVGTSADDMLTITGWSKTEARLVKAIQEQQAMIEELKQEVALLKSK